MKGSEIRKLVLVKMEEMTPFGPDSGEVLLAGGDDLNEVKPIYEYIDASLGESADEMLRVFPIERLRGIAKEASDYMTKEADWLRLYSFEVMGWTRIVRTAITIDNPQYALQCNEWTRGTTKKPVLIDKGTYYTPVPSGESGRQLYIARFDEETDYPREVAEVIALNTARKVYEVFGNTEQASAMQKEIEAVMSLMGI